MSYRVVHWGTGMTGRLALQAVLDRSDCTLVGLYAYSPEKEGKDAGELVGRPAVGITASRDLDALIALKPDIVTYFGNGVRDRAQTTRDVARFLEAGINVVSSSLPFATHPVGSGEPELVQLLEKACETGRSSLFNSGVDPGFITGQLQAVAYGAAHRIDRVRTQEYADYGLYPDEPTARGLWGIGLPMDEVTAVSTGMLPLQAWAGTVRANARVLGWTLDDIRTTCFRAPARQSIDCAIGKVEKGTASVIWFQLIGIVGGEEKLIHEHVNWADKGDIPADWPQPPLYRGGLAQTSYRICIEGAPNYDLELAMPDGNADGLGMTALHCINAIPLTVVAAPGVLDQCDLPPFGPVPLRT